MQMETVASGCRGRCRGVLVIDDDVDVRSMLVEILSLEGYPAEGFESGDDALARLNAGPRPGLILLDLLMPAMDGYQFRAAQLSRSELAHIPVVVFSADARTDEAVIALGAARALRKPVDLDELLAAVGSLCCTSA